jgi:V8-like Glu-specific endopeptidase
MDAVEGSALVRNWVQRRNLLLGIDAGYRNRFFPEPTPGQTLLEVVQDDLMRLNEQDSIEPGQVPLQIWLKNLFDACRDSGLVEQHVFEKALAQMSAIWKGPVESLKIPGQPDYLPARWVEGLEATRPAVGYIEVPVYREGKPFPTEGSGQGMDRGTGWLLGKCHLITCHHVINARWPGEPDADDADLKLQAEAARIYFEYDVEDQKGEPVTVESLCIWRSRLDQTSPLDYAVLKLAKEPGKPSLTVAADSGRLAVAGRPANIVGHPRGKPKQMGIRNNEIWKSDGLCIYYSTDTEPGSSGSPVCSDTWEAIALHRAGQQAEGLNTGVRVDCIVNDVRQRNAGLWEEIGATLK